MEEYNIFTKISRWSETVIGCASLREAFLSFWDRHDSKEFLEGYLKSEIDINAINSDGYTLLSYATVFNYIHSVKYLIEKGANVNVKNSNGTKPLHMAAELGYKKLLEVFFQLGLDINDPDGNGSTPLHCAAKGKSAEVVKFLIEKGANLEDKNYLGETALFIATARGHQNIVQILLDEGSEIANYPNNDWTLLHYASYNGCEKIISQLIYRGVALDKRTNCNQTALLLAAENSHKCIVDILLKAGANTLGESYKKWTLLHHACANGWREVVQRLVQDGSDLNVKDPNGDVPLFLAARNCHEYIIQLLMNSGADIDYCNDNKWTLLHYACQYGLRRVVCSLIRKGKDLNANTSDGISPLIIASKQRYEYIVELLLIYGAYIKHPNTGADINCCTNDKWTAIHFSSKNGWEKVIKSLFEKEADINAKTGCGQTPLLIAANHSLKDTVTLLISIGANINCSNKDGKTLLHFAISHKWSDVVHFLLEKKAYPKSCGFASLFPPFCNFLIYKDAVEMFVNSDFSVSICDDYGWTVLHYATGGGWLDLVKSLLNKGANLNAKTLKGETPLYLAFKYSHESLVEELIELGADINWFDADYKWTAMHWASEYGWENVIRSLYKKGADINAESISGETPLLVAASGPQSSDRKNIVTLLISLEANISCSDNAGRTLLLFTVFHRWLDLVDFLLKNRVYPNAKMPYVLSSLLYEAGRYKDITEMFVNSDISVNICGLDGWTILHYVSKSGWLDLVRLLLEKGADFNAKTLERKTPLLLAAENSHKALVEELIELGADINCCDAENWTTMHYASQNNWLDIVELLIKKGANPDIETSCGRRRTPLLIAAEKSLRDIVKLLSNCAENVDCYTADNDWAVLHYASKYGWYEVVELLVKRGANINATNYEGVTPILIAAKYSKSNIIGENIAWKLHLSQTGNCYSESWVDAKHDDIIQLFIDSGANLNHCDEAKNTILHYSSKFGSISMTDSLIKRRTVLEVINKDGETPLLLAAQYNHLSVVLLLVNAGANLNYSIRKWTILKYSMCNGWLEMMEIFQSRGIDFNLETPTGEIPLALAVLYDKTNIIKFLIEVGVNPNVNVSSNNWTLLHIASCRAWPEVIRVAVEKGGGMLIKPIQMGTLLFMSLVRVVRYFFNHLMTGWKL